MLTLLYSISNIHHLHISPNCTYFTFSSLLSAILFTDSHVSKEHQLLHNLRLSVSIEHGFDLWATNGIFSLVYIRCISLHILSSRDQSTPDSQPMPSDFPTGCIETDNRCISNIQHHRLVRTARQKC